MSELETLEDERRIRLVITSLHSNFNRKRWKRVSARQIINRLLILLQKPMLFLFYENNEISNKNKTSDISWRLIFHSHHDYRFQTEFKEQILNRFHFQKDSGSETDTFYLKSEDERFSDVPCAPYEIGGASDGIGFGYILGTVEGPPKGKYLKLLPSNAKEYDLLEGLWAELLSTSYSKRIGIKERIIFTLKKSFSNTSPLIHETNRVEVKNLDMDDAENHPDFEIFLSTQNKIIDEEVFEEVYNNMCTMPPVFNRGKNPPNFFMVHRYYGLKEHRNRYADSDSNQRYPYSIRAVFPPTQRKILMDVLDELKDRNTKGEVNRTHWNFEYKEVDSDGDANKVKECQYLEFPIQEGRAWFWETLHSSNGREDMLRILQHPYGKSTRALSDPALASGLVHMRPNIYITGGGDRLGRKGFDISTIDTKRLVIFYYLYSMAAPRSSVEEMTVTPENMALLIVPIRAGGKNYITTTQIISMVSQDNELPIVETRKESFLSNYYFFSDIGRASEQLLRTSIKKTYLKQISDILRQEISSPVRFRATKIYPQELCETINMKYEWLSRVWCCDRVEVFIIDGPPEEDNVSHVDVYNSASFHLEFEVIPNSYYYHTAYEPLDVFGLANGWISEYDVKKALSWAFKELEPFIKMVVDRRHKS